MNYKYFLFLIVFSIISFSIRAQISVGDVLSEIDYSAPKEYEIGGITISGIKYLDNNVLIMLSGLSIGDKIHVPGERISKAIHNLWDQGLFENIKVTASKIQGDIIFLNIDLQERPRLSKFSFSGLKKAEIDNLREEIKLTSGDVVTDNLLIRTTNIIKKHYTDKGYLDIQVNITQKQDTAKANNVILNINVEKNDKVKIYHINIYGNKHLTAEKIKTTFKETKEKGTIKLFYDIDSLIIIIVKNTLHLKYNNLIEEARDYISENLKLRIFKSSKFIEEDYNEDKINLIKKYNELGFRDAKIISDSIYRNEDSTINININIEEGRKYYFRNITWVGNTKYTSDELNAILKIKKGNIYNWEVLNSNLNFNFNEDDVSSLYMNDGYLFFSANPVEVLVENDSIDLEIRIHEGKQAIVNKVTIKGNTKTNDHVIIRELRTKPGQLFSRSDIIRSTRELAQLRYFDPESINPLVNPNPVDGTVDIEYEVEETSADQIELSGGWGYGRIIGTLGVSFNNFSTKNFFKKGAWRPIPSGDGQKLSIRVQSYGKGYISYSASFTEPWLGGKKPNAFSVSYYHSLYSNGLNRSDPNRQSFVINGLSFGLGKRLTWPDDFFQIYQGINLQRYDLKNYQKIFSFGSGTGYYNNFSYNIVFSRPSLDAVIYPRYGSNISLSLEATPPYSLFSEKDYSTLDDYEKYKWIEYHKWKFNTSIFTKIQGNLVLMTRAKFGFLGYYNPDIGV
ncbi:MAG: outer membrane protein assembly factor BamA, partial [Bacteroidales bacterium]|nr:outer membrane protein assembly factor BamA [Bacteroidales bacterium]